MQIPAKVTHVLPGSWEPLTYWASEELVVRVNFIIVQTASKKSVVLVLGPLEAAGGHTEGDLFGDPNGIISDKYGSWIPPFSDRNTFLISPDGKISYRWISVLPINHAKEVLNVLKKKI